MNTFSRKPRNLNLSSIAIHPRPIGRERDLACSYVIAMVARHENVRYRQLTNSRRGRKSVARARQLAMYFTHVVLGRTLEDVAIAFDRDRTTVSYACNVIEDLRDDRAYEDELSALEARIETGLAQLGEVSNVLL